MKLEARKAIALFGGVVMLALAVGCGSGSGRPESNTTTMTKNPSSSMTPETSPAGDRPGGCIPGVSC